MDLILQITKNSAPVAIWSKQTRKKEGEQKKEIDKKEK